MINLKEGETLEPLSNTAKVIVSKKHTFNTDTILLMNFAQPKHKELCCDFGTGCDTIPIMWRERFEPKHIYAVELQEDAYDMARRSVELNGFDDAITVMNKDIRELSKSDDKVFEQGLDLVVCNPPYKELGTGIVNHESERARARHELNITLDELAQTVRRVLKYGGRFCMCQRTQRLSEIMTVLGGYDLAPKRLQLVQQRDGKPPKLFLLECKKGARSDIIVEPTLMIEDSTGDFSPEMKAIYGSYKYKEQDDG